MNVIRIFGLVYLMSFTTSAQLVMPGDYPDPSVTKIGDAYWASATTSNWAPVFPLLRSADLMHWQTKGFVFTTPPDWADYYFWAPEISYENGKVYIYYSAHKKGGNLCLGVASADSPEGPYTDHGPLMCQDAGSIDAFPMRDENGKLHLIWKEDGNSVGKPTPIWIIEMKEDRSGFVGEKKELFRNNKEWEANLVEGVSMLRKGDYFYAFYAAAGCCGTQCTYATGVARARKLEGPWEKYERNPILTNDEEWICPGHGTPIEHNGRYFFLYHAYNKESGVFAGRQGLLKEFRFTGDGWIEFVEEDIRDITYAKEWKDEFDFNKLSNGWQWSVLNPASYKQKDGVLLLNAEGKNETAFLGQKTMQADYSARATVLTKQSSADAGLVAIGDEKNILGVSYSRGRVCVWKNEAGKYEILKEKQVGKPNKVTLQMKVTGGKSFVFSYSVDGVSFEDLNTSPVSGAYLPPWDRAVRAGVSARGTSDEVAAFENFILYH